MNRDLVTEAMALAVALSNAQQRAALATTLTDAWLAEGLDAVPYAQASGADPEGFVTVGELRDLRAERTGFVLVHPATKALQIAWSNDFGN
jgi:hypothetical protein